MRPTDVGTEAEEEMAETPAEVENELLEQSLGIAELAAERDSYLDQLQRVAAEFANYRRRTENEREQDRKRAARDLLVQLAPIADDFERALNNIPATEAESSWVEGVRLIERKLEALLERADVHKIEALGVPFDPAVHEAVIQDPDNTESIVVEVYQNGYTLGNQLLRPAMVRVGNLPKAG
jgi:molecular chaperone GrpE